MFIWLNIKLYYFRVCSQGTAHFLEKNCLLYEAMDFWASMTSEKKNAIFPLR